MTNVQRAEKRFLAASGLAAAVDIIVTLEQAEQATGRVFVLEADRERVRAAGRYWTKWRNR